MLAVCVFGSCRSFVSASAVCRASGSERGNRRGRTHSPVASVSSMRIIIIVCVKERGNAHGRVLRPFSSHLAEKLSDDVTVGLGESLGDGRQVAQQPAQQSLARVKKELPQQVLAAGRPVAEGSGFPRQEGGKRLAARVVGTWTPGEETLCVLEEFQLGGVREEGGEEAGRVGRVIERQLVA